MTLALLTSCRCGDTSPAGLAQQPSVPDQPTPSFLVTFLRRPHKCYALPTLLSFHMIPYDQAVTLIFSHESLNTTCGMLHMHSHFDQIPAHQLSHQLISGATVERVEGELQVLGICRPCH